VKNTTLLMENKLMSNTAGKMVSTFRVGVFTCDLAYRPDRGLTAEWSPAVPRKLSTWEMTQYRRGRDTLLGEVAKALGQGVILLEA
jgi:hypothetical protein